MATNQPWVPEAEEDLTPRALAALSQSLGVLVGVGLLIIAVGVILMVWPHQTLVVVAVVFGIAMVIIGLLRIIEAFSAGLTGGHRAALFVLGGLTLVLGVVALRHLFGSVAVLGLLIGVFWLVQGLFGLYQGLTGGPGRRLWPTLAGLLAVVAGIIVIAYPSETLTIIVWVNGVILVLYGLLIIVAGIITRRRVDQLRKAGPTVVDTTAS